MLKLSFTINMQKSLLLVSTKASTTSDLESISHTSSFWRLQGPSIKVTMSFLIWGTFQKMVKILVKSFFSKCE